MEEYTIKIGGRFLKWCDDKWFETSGVEEKKFTKDEVSLIRKQMKKHYHPHITIIDSNGVEIQEKVKKTKKSLFTINKNTFKK